MWRPSVPGKIVRASRVEYIVGGKGINVSRQLQRLGCDTLATGFAGGEIGALIWTACSTKKDSPTVLSVWPA